MANLKPVRGTQDILPEENRLFRRIEETVYRLGRQYGYEEIATPIFESTDVFARTLGDTTDVVTKEMYTFEDRNGDSLTLRPEGTAGVARAFLSNGLAQHLPLKYFYRGPMFRRERPQKGRRRQFHQVGIELLGVADAIGDVEIIALADHLLTELGISDKVVLELNTLGDSESRQVYRDKLVTYFEGHKGTLSEDSLRRLENNPLRILDSKDEADRALVADAPMIDDCLNENRFNAFERLLEEYPVYRGQVTMVQIAPPSRSEVQEYQDIQDSIAMTVGQINGRYAEFDWIPINYLNKGYAQDMLSGFYRSSRVGLVTPLRDGMNLVAKEYVASQNPHDPGVLILSRFAGAARELDAALIINPYDTDEMVQALARALDMTLEERQERWEAMMVVLRANTLDHWLNSFIDALSDAPYRD